MRTLTALESSVVGAISGMIEVFIQQPSVNIKNAVQDKQPVVWNPRILYRGVIVNAASMAPISAIQFGVNTALEERMTGPLTTMDRTGIGLAAGAVSAVVSSPSEVIMIQQQKTGLSILSQVRYLCHHHGWLSLGRGFIPCLVREAVYTATYLGVNPILHEEVMKVSCEGSKSGMKLTPTWALVLASCISGTTATVITQPIDTIKTRMQANVDLIKYRKMGSAFRTIMDEGGYRALYSGIIPRTQRIVCAVLILSEAKEHLTHLYLDHLEKHS
ncbi:hypothetical protein KC19_5G002800 [Ceratodon purpureus]|uniref:Uncharacterized protein n=1 Tax=Ceratodon purpureus TaxID=3225 RepID=A0A8T0HXM1_CERPU|nr:hypothetical protein KC19_5G002800 [Ceratodon purpureus]KAG0575423.1 hypothetical protein KC19_5G002800 [Ceratodon purpureus]